MSRFSARVRRLAKGWESQGNFLGIIGVSPKQVIFLCGVGGSNASKSPYEVPRRSVLATSLFPAAVAARVQPSAGAPCARSQGAPAPILPGPARLRSAAVPAPYLSRRVRCYRGVHEAFRLAHLCRSLPSGSIPQAPFIVKLGRRVRSNERINVARHREYVSVGFPCASFLSRRCSQCACGPNRQSSGWLRPLRERRRPRSERRVASPR
jgi:hypothetical protein